LRGDESKEELTRRPRYLPRALRGGHSFLPLARVLGFETFENPADPVVEHPRSVFGQ
jgi:hypothetical protein